MTYKRNPPESWWDTPDTWGFFYDPQETTMLKGWKTLLFNVALAAVGVAQAADWTSILGATPYTGYVVMVIAALGTVLRSVTNTPVGSKK